MDEKVVKIRVLKDTVVDKQVALTDSIVICSASEARYLKSTGYADDAAKGAVLNRITKAKSKPQEEKPA